jgi:hypothetical protein
MLVGGFPTNNLSTSMGKRIRKSVNAEQFCVFDSDGNMRAWLHAFGGDPRLDLLDENGRARATVALDKGVPTISLLRADGKLLLGLGVSAEGDTGISIARSDGTLQFLVRITEQGAVQMTAFDSNGHPAWSMPTQ